MPDYYLVQTHIRHLMVRFWRRLFDNYQLSKSLRKASTSGLTRHRAELCESVLSSASRSGRVSLITTRGRGGRSRRLDIHTIECLVGRNLESRRPWRGYRTPGVRVNLSRGGCDDGEREGNTRQTVATRHQGDGRRKNISYEQTGTLFASNYFGRGYSIACSVRGYAEILTLCGGSSEPHGRTEALVGRRRLVVCRSRRRRPGRSSATRSVCPHALVSTRLRHHHRRLLFLRIRGDAFRPLDAFRLRLARGRTFDRVTNRQ